MLRMRILTREHVIEALTDSGFKRVIEKRIESDGDLAEVMKATKTLRKLNDPFTVFLVAG